MKTGLGALALAAVFSLATPACAGEGAAALGRAEITFNYQRQSGPGGNQFALWIETADGQFVKTLYATRFAAAGGFAKRPDAIKLWVKRSGRAQMKDGEIDAVTGATPKAGKRSYAWDGTDAAGKPSAAGDYVLCLEGTLRGKNAVVYRTPVKLGGDEAKVEPKPEYDGDPIPERAMIGQVAVQYRPAGK